MITLAYPWLLLLLLLLPGIAGFAYLADRARTKRWARLVAPRLQARLLVKGSPVARWLALTLLLAALAALIAALSRPQGRSSSAVEITRGRNVIFVLDLSRSMLSADVKPDRLSQAKAIFYEILDRIPEDRVGLIGFAGRPHVFGPLTVDHGALRETIEQLTPDSMPEAGSDIGSALLAAAKCFHDTGQHNNALIVISDGEDHTGKVSSAVRALTREGIYVFAVGVGTEDGDYIPDPDSPDKKFRDRNGNPVVTRLQAESLRQLARDTGGRFATANAGADIPAMATAALQDIQTSETRGREHQVSSEFYQWFVLPAVLLLILSIFLSTRWRTWAATATMAWLILPAPLRADDLSDANQAMRAGQFERAREMYDSLAHQGAPPDKTARLRFAEGLAAYHTQSFRDAKTAFSAALLADDPQLQAAAHDGCGMALFQTGWLTLSDGKPEPETTGENDRMKAFDDMVRAKLKTWLPAKGGASGETDPSREFNQLMLNWTDAIRHFRSAASLRPDDRAAAENQSTVRKYLKRLNELLQEQADQTEKSLPPPRPQPDQPKQGHKPDDAKQPQGDKPKDNQSDQNKDNKHDQKGPGDNPDHPKSDNNQDHDSGNPDQPKPTPDKPPQADQKPGETPQERARRILSDNADIRRGPLAPGHHEFIRPEKDW